MKALGAGLSAAWRGVAAGAPGEPFVRGVVDDRLAGGLRFDWTEVYASGSDVGLGHAAVSVAGTIHRARFVVSGGGYDLQTQRVTDPAFGAQWTTWTTRAAGLAATVSSCALVARADGSLWLLWGEQLGGAAALRVMVSGDDGVTWGAAATALSWPGAALAQIAAAESPGGTALGVACLVDAGSGFLARLALHVGGVWSDWPDTAGGSATQAHGVALAWTGATAAAMLVATDGTDGPRVAPRTVVNADGTTTPTWTAGPDVLRRYPGSPVRFGAVRLADLGGDFPGWFVTLVELDGGSARLVGAFTRRPDWFVAPFEVASISAPTGPTGGAALLRRGADWWLISYASARSSPAWTGAAPGDLIEVPAARIVAVEEAERASTGGEAGGGRLTLALDNADGALAGAGTPGHAWRALRAGSRLAVGFGYRHAGGGGVVWGVPWVIERVSREDRQGTGTVVVEAVDAAGWLRRAPLSYDLTLANRTPADLADRVLSRLLAADSGAAEPRLAAHTVAEAASRAGQPPGGLLDLALDAAGVWLRCATAASAVVPTGFADWANAAFVRWDEATPAAAYGPDPASQGPIRLASWTSAEPGLNRVRLLGADPTIVATAVDPVAAARSGVDGWRAVRRSQIDDLGWAVDAAAWELARGRLDAAGGRLDSRPHPGVELYDVVTVTDPRAGLTDAPRRVLGRRTRYDRRCAEYTQRLWLGGV